MNKKEKLFLNCQAFVKVSRHVWKEKNFFRFPSIATKNWGEIKTCFRRKTEEIFFIRLVFAWKWNRSCFEVMSANLFLCLSLVLCLHVTDLMAKATLDTKFEASHDNRTWASSWADDHWRRSSLDIPFCGSWVLGPRPTAAWRSAAAECITFELIKLAIFTTHTLNDLVQGKLKLLATAVIRLELPIGGLLPSRVYRFFLFHS